MYFISDKYVDINNNIWLLFMIFMYFCIFLKRKRTYTTLEFLFLLIEKKLAKNLKFFVEPSKDIKVFFFFFYVDIDMKVT